MSDSDIISRFLYKYVYNLGQSVFFDRKELTRLRYISYNKVKETNINPFIVEFYETEDGKKPVFEIKYLKE